jgi:hypothetical protein
MSDEYDDDHIFSDKSEMPKENDPNATDIDLGTDLDIEIDLDYTHYAENYDPSKPLDEKLARLIEAFKTLSATCRNVNEKNLPANLGYPERRNAFNDLKSLRAKFEKAGYKEDWNYYLYHHKKESQSSFPNPELLFRTHGVVPPYKLSSSIDIRDIEYIP